MSDLFVLFFAALVFTIVIVVSYVIPGSKINDFFDTVSKAFPEGNLKKNFWTPNEYIVPFHTFAFKLWVDPGGKYRPRKTCFSIEMPNVRPFSLRIESHRFFWEDLEELDRKGLLERTTCTTKDPAFQALKYNKEFLQAIYQLVLLGDVRIHFSNTEFQVEIPELFSNSKDALQFVTGCLRIFQKCGQVVYPKLTEWQAPDVNCNFWAPDFIPDIFEDERTLFFPPGELEEELAAAKSSAKKRKLLGNDIVPEKFVLCSICFEKFDGEIVRCPICGAGHHRRCVGDKCGECQTPMQAAEFDAPSAASPDIPPFDESGARFEADLPAPGNEFSEVDPTPLLLEGSQQALPSNDDGPFVESLSLPAARAVSTDGDVTAPPIPGQRFSAAAPRSLALPKAREPLSPSWSTGAPTADDVRLPESFEARAGIEAPTDFGSIDFGREDRFGAGADFDAASAFVSGEDDGADARLGADLNAGRLQEGSSETPREESFEEMLERLRRSV